MSIHKLIYKLLNLFHHSYEDLDEWKINRQIDRWFLHANEHQTFRDRYNWYIIDNELLIYDTFDFGDAMSKGVYLWETGSFYSWFQAETLNITLSRPGYAFSIRYHGDLVGLKESHLGDTGNSDFRLNILRLTPSLAFSPLNYWPTLADEACNTCS